MQLMRLSHYAKEKPEQIIQVNPCSVYRAQSLMLRHAWEFIHSNENCAKAHEFVMTFPDKNTITILHIYLDYLEIDQDNAMEILLRPASALFIRWVSFSIEW